MLLLAKDKSPFVQGVRREVFYSRRNVNILITGKTQTRKSTISVALARMLCEKFDLEKHLAVIRADRLLQILKDTKFKRGWVVVADDFGVGLNHRQWHSFLNKALNYSMMTHGFKGIIMIVNVPYESYIDKDTRLLFDYEITLLSKNDSERCAKVKIEQLHHIEKRGTTETYKVFPRIKFPNGVIKIARSFKIHYPPEDIMKKYFEISSEAKNTLYHDLHAESQEINQRKARQNFSLDYYVEEVMKRPDEFKKIWQHRPLIDMSILRNEFQVGGKRAEQIKTAVEKKLGWDGNTRVSG